MIEKLLRVDEYADRTGMKVVTIRSWIAKRRIAFVRLGRSIRIPESELSRLISENTVPACEQRNRRAKA